MGMPKNCFKIVQSKFGKSSQTNASPSGSIEEINVTEETTYISEEPNSSASSTQLFQKKDLTKEDIAAIKIQSFFRGHLSSKKKETGMSQKYFSRVQRKFRKRSQRDITSPQTHTSPNNSTEKSIDQEETIKFEDPNSAASSSSSPQMKDSTKEDVAAIKIQATFQGHRNIATSSKKKRMGKHQNCFNGVQIRLHKRSHKDKISPHANTGPSSSMEEAIVEKEATNFEDLNGATSSIPPFQRNDLTKEDIAAIKIQAIFRGHRMSQNWFNIVRREFRKTPHRDIILSHTNTCARSSTDEKIVPEETINFENANGAACSIQLSKKKDLTKEDIAAIKIQTSFRGHLARRASRALKSLVKLQAVVRGVCVRKQARIALHCMHALAQLQVRVRARQLLNSNERESD
ncbi:protein iq-domain 1 [Quercus suber]|uniref:Protein iq-domain 1 n=1 Tax=Quercus suber TaxID=58331 RepID=A0AAW0KPA0_QUESU